MFNIHNYITLKDFMDVVKYKISSGSEYQWQCYGSDAFMIDSVTEDYTLSVVFDTRTQTVFQVEAWDYNKDREYRWISPIYIEKYKAEVDSRGIIDNSIDEKQYIDLDLAADIIEKARAIVNGEDYDTRVQVPVELPEEDLNKLMKMAHEQDITLNHLIENIIKVNIFQRSLGKEERQLELDF